MKKIFGTLAMALCLTAMVSCGGDKKDNNNNDQQTEQTEQTGDPIKAKVDNFYNRAKTILDDEQAQMQLINEMEEYRSTLSGADQKKFDKYISEKPDLK